MTYSEFIAHLADYQLEPWDEARGDLQSAQVVCTLANLHRPSGRPPYTLDDCRLQFARHTETAAAGAEAQPSTPTDTVRRIERFFDRYQRHHANH